MMAQFEQNLLTPQLADSLTERHWVGTRFCVVVALNDGVPRASEKRWKVCFISVSLSLVPIQLAGMVY